MRTSFKNQLNQWRKVNHMPTMNDVLKDNTHYVGNKEEDIWSVVSSHATLKTDDSEMLKMYSMYRTTLILLIGKLRQAIACDDVMEAELLKDDIDELNTEYFHALRKITGQNYVMSINHDENKDVFSNGLKVDLYPVKVKNGVDYRFMLSEFEDKNTGEIHEHVTLVIPYKKGGKK